MKKKSNRSKPSAKPKPAKKSGGKKKGSGSLLKKILMCGLVAAAAYGAYLFFTQKAVNTRSIESGLENIKTGLERSGKVVGSKAKEWGNRVADATSDTRNTTAIKAKILADSTLSVLDISVNTTDGVVTLAGSVETQSQLDRLVEIAMSGDGTKEVISNVSLKPKK